MLISIEDAATILEVTKPNFYNSSKLSKLVVKTEDGSKIDSKAVNDYIKAQQEKEDFCYEMTFFAEWVKKYIGTTAFNEPFSRLERGLIRAQLKDKLSFARAKVVEKAWWEKYHNKYQKYIESDDDAVYIPATKRKPITKKYIKEVYWSNDKSVPQIAEELNVPAEWVYKQIVRLGMGKTKNGIKHRGRKGWKAPESYKICRQNQPHSKPVYKIDPNTLEVIKEYRSLTSVEEDGFNRENVRRAAKRAGYHKGFYWAEKGSEKTIINLIKKRGDLQSRKNLSSFVPPTKERLKLLYVDNDMTLNEVAKIYKCHPHVIAMYAKRYGLSKKIGKPSEEFLNRLYVDERKQAKEIAAITGHKPKTIARYLSSLGIKKGTRNEKK